MISLSVVILTFAILFVGLYFVYKMNKNDSLHVGPNSSRRRRHHKKDKAA